MRRSTLISAVAALTTAGVALWPSPLDEHRGEARLLASLNDIAVLSQAVEIYRKDSGDFPTESQGLQVLVSSTPPVLDKLPHDPWGRPYIYRRMPSTPGFELHSTGLNGRDEGGAGDDVNSRDKAYRCENYQVNCGMTPSRLWLLFLASAFLASVGMLVLNGIRFVIDRFRTKPD